MPGASQPTPLADIDEWLRLGLLDSYCRWADGTARTCLHAPDPRRPQPVWSAAWKPGLIVCTACLALLRLRGEADRRCDCCGRVCAGIEHNDGIYTMTVWLGALAYQAGACKDCRPGFDRAAQ